MRKWLKKPCVLFKSIGQMNPSLYAGSWAFFLLLAVVPLAFLLIMAFDFFGLDARFLIADLPADLSATLGEMFDVAAEASNGATLIFILTVLFSASKLFSVMLKDGELIYLERRESNGIWRKMLAFVVLSVIFLIFAVLAFFLLINDKLIALLPKNRFNTLFSRTLINLTILSITYLIVVTVDLFICPIRNNIKNVLLGALCSLAIIVIGTIGFLIYVRFFASYGNLYGGLASIVVFMLWTYIVTYGLVFGNVVTKLLTPSAAKPKKNFLKEMILRKT